jgi:hypothetical protein
VLAVSVAFSFPLGELLSGACLFVGGWFLTCTAIIFWSLYYISILMAFIPEFST